MNWKEIFRELTRDLGFGMGILAVILIMNQVDGSSPITSENMHWRPLLAALAMATGISMMFRR